jgi:hypothetical protein
LFVGSELGRLATPGLRLCPAFEAGNWCTLLLSPVDDSVFFSSLGTCDSGVGGRTITWAPRLVLEEFRAASSSSELCGDMKRAVGRGPFEDGPRDFFSMGGGIADGFLELLESCGPFDDWLSGLKCIAVVLAVPGPRERDGPYKLNFSSNRQPNFIVIFHTSRPPDSSRLSGPRNGTKLVPSEISAKRRATVAPLRLRFRLPHMRHQ